MNSKRKQGKMRMVFIRLLQFLVILILVVLAFIVSKGIYYRIQDERNRSEEIKTLKTEVKKFDQENKNLNKLVKYFDSVEFQEKEIKDKLNLVKNGERIVFVQGNVNNETNSIVNNRQNDSKVVTTHSNYYHWWKYFFEQ